MCCRKWIPLNPSLTGQEAQQTNRESSFEITHMKLLKMIREKEV